MLSIPSACLSSFAVLLDEYVGINGVVGLGFRVARGGSGEMPSHNGNRLYYCVFAARVELLYEWRHICCNSAGLVIVTPLMHSLSFKNEVSTSLCREKEQETVRSLFWFQLVFFFHLFNYGWDRKTSIKLTYLDLNIQAHQAKALSGPVLLV